MNSKDALEHRIQRLTGRAIGDFGLIENHDRILVALSGGKDSWTLLHILDRLRQRAPINFSLIAVTVHSGFPDFRTDLLEDYLREKEYEYHIVKTPLFPILLDKLTPSATPCPLCSRMRRGVLYTKARELDCTKIALGHHREDFIETLLLNLFYNGKIKAMSPFLNADDGLNVVIRPMVYVPESDIIQYVATTPLPVISCACPAYGRMDMKRVKIKKLLADLERERPGIKASMLAALANVDQRHLLAKSPDKICSMDDG
jgi:tRNA 2-thiocytidine biosynthesis protein TtcA